MSVSCSYNYLENEPSVDQYDDGVDNIEDQEDQSESETIKTDTFNDFLKDALIKCGCLSYLVVGISTCIANFGHGLEKDQSQGTGLVKIITSLLIISYVINTLLIIYNRIANTYKLPVTSRISTNLLLYAIVIPLFTVTILYLLFQIVTQIITAQNDLDQFNIVFTIFYSIFLISVIILLVDENRIEMSKIPPHKKLVRNGTILITSVGVYVSILLFVVRKEVSIFLEYSGAAYNVTYSNRILIYFTNQTIYQQIEEHFFPVHLAFLVICVILLSGSFYEDGNANGNVNYFFSSTYNIRKLNCSFCDMLLGVIILILSIVIIPLTVNEEVGTVNYSIFFLVHCFIYLLGIILSIIQIRNIKSWPLATENHKTASTKGLILIGGFGQIIFIINYTSIAIETLHVTMTKTTSDYGYQILSQCLLLLSLILLAVQVASQNITVHLTLKRTPQVSEQDAKERNYYSIIGLFCLNVGCVFTILYLAPMSSAGEFESISVNLFQKGLHMIAIILSLIYRLHGSMFFMVIMNKLHIQ